MRAFDYFAPRTLPEALALLARHNGDARVLAGGSDLYLQIKNGQVAPAVVVNIKRLPELAGLEWSPQTGLRIGALTTLGALNAHPAVREHYPCLKQATNVMGSKQIRNFATAGGNLCNASPSADLAPPFIVLGAQAHIAGPQGERTLPVEDFFLGPGQSALEPGELLVAVNLPPPEGRALYMKYAPRVYMELAVVGVAVWLQREGERCADCRIALGAVAPTPVRARLAEAVVRGAALTAERIAEAGEAAAAECAPIDDVRGSAWYRRRMVGVLLKRGLVELVA